MENSEQYEIDLDELRAMLKDRPDNDRSVRWEKKPEPEPEKPEEPAQEEKKEKEKDSWQKTVLLYLHDLIYLLAALIVVSLLLFRVVVVSGTSMNNTLLDGDYLLVLSNTFYQKPQRGDIVVVSKETFDDGAPIVKRVIATEGQTVNIDFNLGIVYVDGEPLDEPYTLTATTMKEGVEFPLTVDEGCIFVLGDNRGVSRDSRSPEIGQIDEREVLGKVFFLFLPGTNGEDPYGNPKVPRDWTRIGVVG